VSSPFQRIITGLIVFLLVCGVAVVGYLQAGWNLMDSLYMVVITIFGVGYGEVQPVQSPFLRGLTIATIVAGYAAVIYTVGGFIQMVVDGEINRALGARRMNREIQRINQHTIVCGFGRIGSMVAGHLAANGKRFVVIERQSDRVREAEGLGYLVLEGNAAEEAALAQAGIERAKVLAALLSEDAANLFITITARELNPRLEILARGEQPSTERKLLRSGANRVILPMAIGAARIAQLITRPSAESLLGESSGRQDLNGELARIGLELGELQVASASPLAGRAVGDIEVRGNLGFLVVALRRADGHMVMNPEPATQVYGGDTVIVLGHHQDIPQLARQYSLSQELTYRGVKVQA
jgi:voltage-gated potassium channel